MRFMISFRMPTDKGNQLIREGKLGETIQSIMEDLKPEAVYFTDVDGDRGGYLIVNMDHASELPALLEPLFQTLDATIQVNVVLTPEDLQRASPTLEQAVQKYS
ncbi:MAG TPA: hypothetical protein VK357_16615 [Rubrobacteraceae bacterium]|nr:hypothetical protein [Rubrobacteraceae bacterium]